MMEVGLLVLITYITDNDSSRTLDVDISGLPTSTRVSSQVGNRSFSVAGPRLWDNLPREIRRRGTIFGHYRRLLKAFLFV